MTSARHPQFRFETLVVGAANRLAATAARAVAEAPGSVYNPLFVYARPGLGKTHLLMAIAHAAVAIDPRLVVQYLTLDAFLESFNTAVASGQGEGAGWVLLSGRVSPSGSRLVSPTPWVTEM